MHRGIVYIADFFLDHILGGGELNDNELIKMLRGQDCNVELKQSHLVELEDLIKKEDHFFIISNFCNLSQPCRDWLANKADYVIYEHDHKYLSSRNPAVHKDFKAPLAEIRNYFFYKNARRVITQSSFHKEIVEKNLGLKNTISISGNLWSTEFLEKLRQNSKEKKQDKCSILNSKIEHKNTTGAIRYCEEKRLKYEVVANNSYEEFLKQLGANKTLVFLPKTPETLSRIVVEARMMGMSVRTNSLVGACHEPWFELKGPLLIDYMIDKRQEVLDIFKKLIASPKRRKDKKEISIISTFHEGEKYLSGFLENITEQTVFDKCELIIVDSNSSGRERQIIQNYIDKYDNIFYHRISTLEKPTPCLNLAIQKSEANYITFGLIDDRKSKTCLEALLKEIKRSKVDLVYGSVAQTSKDNEKFEENDLKKLFSHSTLDFSRENMVKCLPGPMPLWTRTMHDRCGFFDEVNYNFADDWEMWLRAVNSGCVFKKINKTIGLYLAGGRSQRENNIEQRKEESRLFFKYGHMFGRNFDAYKTYFQQF